MANNLNKKTTSFLYSITIRTGNGIILGSNPVNDLFAYLRKNFKFFIFSIEMENEKAHFQGAVLSETTLPSKPKRQDNIRRDILKFVEQMYIEGLGNALPTDKGLQAMRKYALKVKPHNNFDIIVRYALKEGISYPNVPYQYSLPQELQAYVPEQYCEHNNVTTICSECYKQEDTEVVVLPPDGYERLINCFTGKPFFRKIIPDSNLIKNKFIF